MNPKKQSRKPVVSNGPLKPKPETIALLEKSPGMSREAFGDLATKAINTPALKPQPKSI
jgi:hypothetical protein